MAASNIFEKSQGKKEGLEIRVVEKKPELTSE